MCFMTPSPSTSQVRSFGSLDGFVTRIYMMPLASVSQIRNCKPYAASKLSGARRG